MYYHCSEESGWMTACYLEAVQFSGLSCSVYQRIIVYYSEALIRICSSVACMFLDQTAGLFVLLYEIVRLSA